MYPDETAALTPAQRLAAFQALLDEPVGWDSFRKVFETLISWPAEPGRHTALDTARVRLASWSDLDRRAHSGWVGDTDDPFRVAALHLVRTILLNRLESSAVREIARVADSPIAAVIRALVVRRCDTNWYQFWQVPAMAKLTGVIHLEIFDCYVSAHTAQAMFQPPALPGLTSLSVIESGFSDAGIELLVNSPLAGQLTHLVLRDNVAVTDAGVHRLAEATTMNRLVLLDLDESRVGPRARRALSIAPHLAGTRIVLGPQLQTAKLVNIAAGWACQDEPGRSREQSLADILAITTDPDELALAAAYTPSLTSPMPWDDAAVRLLLDAGADPEAIQRHTAVRRSASADPSSPDVKNGSI